MKYVQVNLTSLTVSKSLNTMYMPKELAIL